MDSPPKFTLDDEAKQAYLEQVPNIIGDAQATWQRLRDNVWNKDDANKLYESVQGIASNSALHDLEQLSDAALSLDVYFSSFVETGRDPNPSQLIELDKLFIALQAAAASDVENMPEAAPAAAPAPASAAGSSKQIYCLHREAGAGSELAPLLTEKGFQLTAFDEPQALVKAMGAQEPAAIIADTALLPVIAPLSNELSRRQAQQGQRPPLAFISNSDDLATRIAAMRAGANRYFAPPLDNDAIAADITEMSQPKQQAKHRVMVIDDDPPQAEFAASILRKSGMDTVTVTQPLRVLEVLEDFKPDLILMDIYMPEANGMELTSIIRDNPDYVLVPIVFLSGEQSADKQVDALATGGDDFVVKPIRPRHLISVINNRIKRAKSMLRASAPLSVAEEPLLEKPDAEPAQAVAAEAPEPDTTTQAAAAEAAEPQTPDPLAQLGEQLKNALARDSLKCLYQPILNLTDKVHENYSMIVGLPQDEGLLYWDDFAAAAKQAKLLERVDRWVLDKAIDVLDNSRKQNKKTRTFVYQTLAGAYDSGQPNWIMSRLRARHLVGTGLILEFRVSELSQQLKTAKTYFDALREMGIQICLSRFPDKEAAFKLVRFLNADYVKVSPKLLDAENEAISQFVEQAHRQRAQVLVPDISDPRHVNLHWTSVADLIQGDFISPASEAMDFDFNQATM